MPEKTAPDPDYSADRRTSRKYAFSPDFTWNGVKVERYKPEGDDFQGIIRQVIIGYREQTDFHVRYFEIAPGGHSSLEKHEHTHVIIGVRGQGKVLAGSEVYDLDFLDTVYVSAGSPHQLVNTSGEPFGFICVVDADRDRPAPLDPAEAEKVLNSPATRDVVKTRKFTMIKT